jgi:type VI secretion system secreted protein Hcp
MSVGALRPKGLGDAMASDCFLKLEGIEGESQDYKHKNEIQLEEWSWGQATAVTSVAAASGGGKGKVQMKDVLFVARVSKASPKLMQYCAGGKSIPKAVLTCRKAGKEQQEYFVMTLSDSYVSHYEVGHDMKEHPTDDFSLNFSKIEVEYKEQKEDGTLGASYKFGWDVKTNKSL